MYSNTQRKNFVLFLFCINFKQLINLNNESFKKCIFKG